uniref:cysteine--tRNA ligase n=1 Tax=Nitrosomonas sp. TaxID=42353 RepID=UPI00374DE9DB
MLKIYNSIAREKQDFVPILPGKVKIYVCGMTVYDYCHLGHARVLVVFDTVVRWFKANDFDVSYVRNITDIDDKIIKRAQENNESIETLTDRFIQAMNEDSSALGVSSPTYEPRATGYVENMIGMIGTLVEKNLAYQASNGDVYYAVHNFPSYGKLSGKSLNDLRAGERVEIDSNKKDPLDFVLWKSAKPGEPSWESPWGKGRPGWHIECSAMSEQLLGVHFDIHGGGQDLQFPHHENEIAQNFGACNCMGANYWLHANMLLLNGKKMSKSDGNNITPAELFTGNSPHVSKGYTAMIARFFFLQAHYGSTLDMNDDALQAAEKGYKRLMEANKILQSLDTLKGGDGNFILDKDIKDLMAMTYEDMNDNFNAPKAL